MGGKKRKKERNLIFFLNLSFFLFFFWPSIGVSDFQRSALADFDSLVTNGRTNSDPTANRFLNPNNSSSNSNSSNQPNLMVTLLSHGKKTSINQKSLSLPHPQGIYEEETPDQEFPASTSTSFEMSPLNRLNRHHHHPSKAEASRFREPEPTGLPEEKLRKKEKREKKEKKEKEGTKGGKPKEEAETKEKASKKAERRKEKGKEREREESDDTQRSNRRLNGTIYESVTPTDFEVVVM